MNSFYNIRKLFNKETVIFRKINNYYGNKFVASIKSSNNNICTVNSPDNYSHMRFNVSPYITQLEKFKYIEHLNISEYHKKIFEKIDNYFFYVRQKLYNYQLEIDKKNFEQKKSKKITKSIISSININNYLNPKIYIEFEENFKSIKYIFFTFSNLFSELKEADFLLNIKSGCISIDLIIFAEEDLIKYLDYNITLIDNYIKGDLE